MGPTIRWDDPYMPSDAKQKLATGGYKLDTTGAPAGYDFNKSNTAGRRPPGVMPSPAYTPGTNAQISPSQVPQPPQNIMIPRMPGETPQGPVFGGGPITPGGGSGPVPMPYLGAPSPSMGAPERLPGSAPANGDPMASIYGGAPPSPSWAFPGLTDAQRNAPLPTTPYMDIAAGRARGGGFKPGGLNNIPSMQALNRLSPSEQAGLGGFYESQLGIPWNDVQWQSDKLRPRAAFGAAPAWSQF